MNRFAICVVLAGMFAATSGCSLMQSEPAPGQRLARRGDEIVVCGQLFHTGAPVVLWTDPGGYDAYRTYCKFTPDREKPSNPVSDSFARFSPIRRHLPDDVKRDIYAHGWRLADLQQYVDLFVIHYDVCGTSRRCFEVLHDLRGLSVHFMLDLDGTIYQTLDAKERAWHAGPLNDRSVGIEIANIGAYEDMNTLDKWYARDEQGRTYVTLPASMGDGGERTPDFVARPSRDGVVTGTIHNRSLHQYDFTDAQYDSMIKLTATLSKVLPRIRADYPRTEDGQLRRGVLSEKELAAFSGLIAHWHITEHKVDPGPAFDWDRVVNGARAYLDK